MEAITHYLAKDMTPINTVTTAETVDLRYSLPFLTDGHV